MSSSLAETNPTVAHIVSPEGEVLPVHADDALWLYRAVHAEGAPRALVAQTLVNRWAWLHDRMPAEYPRLRDLVRAYAQPVNPRWYPEGDKHLSALAKGADTAARAVLRRDVHSTRTDFDGPTRQAVHVALYGPLTLPRGAVHYSVPREGKGWKSVELVRGEAGKSNSIYSAKAARGARYSLPGERLTTTTDRKSGRALLAVLALLSLGGVALVYRARTQKKEAARVGDLFNPSNHQEDHMNIQPVGREETDTR